MQKVKIFYSILLSSVLIASTGCASMASSFQNKLADLQLQKKQLANGKPVYIDVNLEPASNWACTQVGVPQYYNWSEIRMQSQFQWGGWWGLLTDKALAFANQQNLNTNYINLVIPDENTFSTGTGRFSVHHHLNNYSQAEIHYYQCRAINPSHALGHQEKTDVDVRSE